MKRIFLFLSVLFCTIGVFAQHRSEQEAKQIAQQFFAKDSKHKAPQLSVVPQQQVKQQIQRRVHAAKSAPTTPSSCYIINDEANNRFVIVSADERMDPILGYSDNSLFDDAHMPIQLLNLIKGYDSEYNYYIQNGDDAEAKDKAAPNSESSSVVIEPMIKTKWGQGEPFNALCPTDPTDDDGSAVSVTGCIATAMAQIINYHKYAKTNGIYSYTPRNFSNPLIMDFSKLSFNWDNLIDDYSGASAEQEAEVAKLMYACGVSVAMNYGYGGSGANDFDIPYSLIHYFGYNPNIVYKRRDFYTGDEWYSIITQNLEAKMPVLYAGDSENRENGHEFIIDGRDADGLYHLNFGQTLKLGDTLWSGVGDGYYKLHAIKYLNDYSYHHSMVCNICPPKYGDHEDTFYCEAFKLVQLYSSLAYYYVIAQCFSSETHQTLYENEVFEGKLGIGLFDLDKNFIADMYSESVSLSSYTPYVVEGKLINLDTSAMEDWTPYIIAPFVQSVNSSRPSIVRSHILGDDEERKDIADFYYLAMTISGAFTYIDNPTIDAIMPIYTTDNDDVWYSLQGIRLTDKPTQSGIYLHKGKKVFVK